MSGTVRVAADAAAIAWAGGILAHGGLIAFPTETVYGLGANALDPAAVRRIFEAKGRPAWNPLIVHVADVAQARALAAHWPEAAERLATAFWPGPLSLVVPRGPQVPDIVTGGLDAVALRMLQRRRWTGNVRELRNAVERLLILAAGAEVTEDDVALVLPPDAAPAIDVEKLVRDAGDRNFAEFKEDAERAFIVARLREHLWNVSETARALGMPRSNLYNKIEKYGIERGD